MKTFIKSSNQSKREKERKIPLPKLVHTVPIALVLMGTTSCSLMCKVFKTCDDPDPVVVVTPEVKDTVVLTDHVFNETPPTNRDATFFDLLAQNSELSYFDVRDSFNAFWNNLNEREKEDHERDKKLFDRWDYFWAPRIAGLDGSFDTLNYILANHYLQNPPQNLVSGNRSSNNNWTPVGPDEIPANNSSYSLNYKGVGRVTKVKFHNNYDGTYPIGTPEPLTAKGHNTLYAGTRMGGLWKSTDGGANWFNPSQFLLPQGVQDLELFGADRIYTVSTVHGFNYGDHGLPTIQRSEDGGETWFISGAPFDYSSAVNSLATGSIRINDLTVHPRCWYVASRSSENQENGSTRAPTCNMSRLLVASSLGVHYSDDNCLTWTKVLDAANLNYSLGPNEVVVNPKQTNELYTFGSVNWNDMTQGKNANEVYRSVDEGLNWYLWKTCNLETGTNAGFNLGLPAANLPDARVSQIKLIPSKQSKDKLYAVVWTYYMGNSSYSGNGVSYNASNRSKQWLLKTEDRGATWTTVLKGTSYFNRTVDFEIDPWNDDVIHYCDAGGYASTAVYYRLTINPATNVASRFQQPSYNSGMHADVRDLELKYIPNGGNQGVNILAGTDGGINITPNSTASTMNWTNITGKGLHISEIYKFSNTQITGTDALVAGLQDNGSFSCNYDAMGTSDWRMVVRGDGMDCQYDPQNGSRYFSTDGQTGNGQAVYQYNSSTANAPSSSKNTMSMGTGEWVYPIEFDQSNPSNLYIGKQNLWKKTGSVAGTWQAVMTPTQQSQWFPNGTTVRAFKVANSNSMVIARRWNSSIYTIDAGATWTQLLDPEPDPTKRLHIWGQVQFAYDPGNPTTLFVAISGFITNSVSDGSLQKVYKITNLGQPNEKWTNWSNGLTVADQVNCIAYDNTSDMLYIGTDHGVYRKSAVTSGNWTMYGNKLPMTYVTDIDFRHDKNVVRASTFGRGLWEIQK
ncbi:MAG: hypothetical protein HWE22_15655 [Flavobacteriales bacterium]|nr:hypothetical protein [Flavobacteriales bacterium]